MKSDKKRTDREKTNEKRTDREKSDKVKSNKEESNKEKSNKVKSNKEKSNKEKNNGEKLSAEMPDAEMPDAVKEDEVRGDVIKEDAEMPGKEKQDSAESAVDGRDAEDGERAPEESGLEKATAAEANETEEAGSTGETCSAEEAGSTGEAGSTEETCSAEETGSQEKNSEIDSAAKVHSEKFDDQEEEGEDWENDDSPDDWEEESEPSKPWVVALVFLGMIFAAACICVMLWSFTHSDEAEKQNVFAGATVAPGSVGGLASNGTTPLGTGNQPLENQGGDAASVSEPSGTDAPASDLNRVTTQDGRVIIFTECDDIVTPKEYVNLRTEPSTSQGDATVGCRLNQGEKAHRTGISEEMGWSRVEYNDQILYVVSSLVSVATDTTTAE